MSGMQLRLAQPLQTLGVSLHNGPGWRLCLWLQGCSLRCTEDCLNPAFLSAEGGYPVSLEALLGCLRALVASHPWPVEGLTVLGGEPTDQLLPVTAMLRAVRAEGLSTMLYTGLTLAALRARYGSAATDLLAQLDLLVDGPFLPHRYDEHLPWRGSDNQRVICCTDRYSPSALAAAQRRQGKAWSVRIDADGAAVITGLQVSSAAERIFAELEAAPTATTQSTAISPARNRATQRSDDVPAPQHHLRPDQGR